MTPTPKLRFVERQIDEMSAFFQTKTIRVLQQWWVEPPIMVNLDTGEMTGSHGEWRDVPCERE
jgi:hypothetical protein